MIAPYIYDARYHANPYNNYTKYYIPYHPISTFFNFTTCIKVVAAENYSH